MSKQGMRRTFSTPKGYVNEQDSRVALLNSVYIGFVKDNTDEFMMGRLKVWIPEFSKNPDDSSQWFTVSYCSPFAGATPASEIKKGSTKYEDSQRSYGWWAVPPDIDNEVIVMFINGDPNKGIWIGCLYQQFMNQMVPGISAAPSFDEGVEGEEPPVAEYNKWGDEGAGNPLSPVRPRFEPLHEGLKNQGLYGDFQRGPTTASSRRSPVSDVYGFLSPGGSQFVFDDDENNQYVRIRTKSGAQILINDTTGFVYINSKNGNSWLEVSDDAIDVYTAKSFSVRAQEDINFHADGNMNFYSKRNMNFFSGGETTMQAGGGLQALVGRNLNITAAGSVNMSSTLDVAITGATGVSVYSPLNVAISGNATVSVSSTGVLSLSGTISKVNSGPGTTARIATPASAPELTEASDRELNVDSNYEEITTKTLVSRLVTHEPFDLHPVASKPPARQRLDLSTSSRTLVDGNAKVPNNQSTDYSSSDEDSNLDKAEIDENAGFVTPITGTITSLYGNRKAPTSGASRNHKGVDVGAPIGTPVIAMSDGIIKKAGWGTGYGRVIYISHDDGYETRYAHLDKINVKPGQKVKKGEIIAKSGNTGVGTGPHLHFEIRKGGVALDPAKMLPDIKKGHRMIAGKGIKN